MNDSPAYGLVDSGGGRKLERFGKFLLDRPCSQAIWRRALPESEWQRADAFFDRDKGLNWQGREKLPPEWTIKVEGIAFRLSSTDFGHLGIFPEQRASWRWIGERVRAAGRPVSVLNLFAYSGGSTMAAALAGAEVCHLDASQGMVEWARHNAELNGLKARPIRWIVDDAHKFMNREIKRGRRYDAVVLDPPSFGRGTRGEVYKIERDLPVTLDLCRRLLSNAPVFMLLSAHTPGVTPIVLQHLLEDALAGAGGSFENGEMLLEGPGSAPPTQTPPPRPVPSGCFARWNATP